VAANDVQWWRKIHGEPDFMGSMPRCVVDVITGGVNLALWTLMTHFVLFHWGWGASFIVGLAVGTILTLVAALVRVAMGRSGPT
jgi:hypothetical protein